MYDTFNRKDINRLPTWLDEINDLRSDWAHHHDIGMADFKRSVDNIKRISETLGHSKIGKDIDYFFESIVDTPNNDIKKESDARKTEQREANKISLESEDDNKKSQKSKVEVKPHNLVTVDNSAPFVLDDLDHNLLKLFKGFVVKKELVHNIKSGANVPVFVLEYLLANSCSTDDPKKIKQGIALSLIHI